MKLFVTTIATVATLLLAQGCSSSVQSGETASNSAATKQHEGRSMGNEELGSIKSSWRAFDG
jgi:hypothetical protein